MSLAKRIEGDFIVAYKAKDEIRVAVLRMLKTAIKHLQVELLREPTEDELVTLLKKQLKQRQEAAEMFANGGRAELSRKELDEAEVLRDYLPRQLSTEELAAAVEAAITSTGAASPKDMGKVMQALNAAHKGLFDGKAASELVKSRLS